jgi:hypothetical protein
VTAKGLLEQRAGIINDLELSHASDTWFDIIKVSHQFEAVFQWRKWHKLSMHNGQI